MFDIFNKNRLDDEIERLYLQIINSTTYKYFKTDNPVVLIVYKEFEAYIVAAALYYSKIQHSKSETELKKIYSDIVKICFKKTSPFLRDYILSGILMFDILQNEPLNETDISLEVYAKIGRYVKDIGHAMKNHKPYFTENWPGEYEEEEIEGAIIYGFISNLFLSEINMNYDNKQYIHIKEDYSIDEEEFELLEKFADEYL